MTRRELFGLIGRLAGAGAMYQAMAQLGYAQESGYTGRVRLEGDPKGASVLILGAGLAGLSAALELQNAGYKVRVLEYNARAGGRNWSIYGGDVITELGGATQHCRFEKGLYMNPGPWRIPHHHYAVIDYCKRLKVPLQPFTQVNHNAYVHSSAAFGGRPPKTLFPMDSSAANIRGLAASAADSAGKERRKYRHFWHRNQGDP
jgi:monoamine oxidase